MSVTQNSMHAMSQNTELRTYRKSRKPCPEHITIRKIQQGAVCRHCLENGHFAKSCSFYKGRYDLKYRCQNCGGGHTGVCVGKARSAEEIRSILKQANISKNKVNLVKSHEQSKSVVDTKAFFQKEQSKMLGVHETLRSVETSTNKRLYDNWSISGRSLFISSTKFDRVDNNSQNDSSPCVVTSKQTPPLRRP